MPGTGVIDASRKFHRARSTDANEKIKAVRFTLSFSVFFIFSPFLSRTRTRRIRRDLFLILFFLDFKRRSYER